MIVEIKSAIVTGATISSSLTAVASGDLPLADVILNGGFTAVGLGVGWVMLRRSDNNEKELRHEAQDALAEEREAHAKTRTQLMSLLQSKTKNMHSTEDEKE